MKMTFFMAKSNWYLLFTQGLYFTPDETIYILMMAAAFMGYMLPQSQMSYRGEATIITNLFSAVYYIGAMLMELLGTERSYSSDPGPYPLPPTPPPSPPPTPPPSPQPKPRKPRKPHKKPDWSKFVLVTMMLVFVLLAMSCGVSMLNYTFLLLISSFQKL